MLAAGGCCPMPLPPTTPLLPPPTILPAATSPLLYPDDWLPTDPTDPAGDGVGDSGEGVPCPPHCSGCNGVGCVACGEQHFNTCNNYTLKEILLTKRTLEYIHWYFLQNITHHSVSLHGMLRWPLLYLLQTCVHIFNYLYFTLYPVFTVFKDCIYALVIAQVLKIWYQNVLYTEMNLWSQTGCVQQPSNCAHSTQQTPNGTSYSITLWINVIFCWLTTVILTVHVSN